MAASDATLHFVRIVVEKRWLGFTNRMLFTAMLEAMYERVGLPFFPYCAEAEAELHDRIVAIEADEPVASPEEVGLAP